MSEYYGLNLLFKLLTLKINICEIWQKVSASKISGKYTLKQNAGSHELPRGSLVCLLQIVFWKNVMKSYLQALFQS